MILYKKILFMFCLLICAVFQIFANSKISLANKSLFISKILEDEENDDNYDEYDSEELYEEEYEEYEDEDEEIEYYDKNDKKVIFVDSSYGKNKQSKSNKSTPNINIVNSSANSNTALSPYNLAYYNEHKKTTGGAFGCSFLNFILGFGIGSFVKGMIRQEVNF